MRLKRSRQCFFLKKKEWFDILFYLPGLKREDWYHSRTRPEGSWIKWHEDWRGGKQPAKLSSKMKKMPTRPSRALKSMHKSLACWITPVNEFESALDSLASCSPLSCCAKPCQLSFQKKLYFKTSTDNKSIVNVFFLENVECCLFFSRKFKIRSNQERP